MLMQIKQASFLKLAKFPKCDFAFLNNHLESMHNAEIREEIHECQKYIYEY
jgi:ssDNA-binding Zn-finger/Zn-ribbon topoisomerase 1